MSGWSETGHGPWWICYREGHIGRDISPNYLPREYDFIWYIGGPYKSVESATSLISQMKVKPEIPPTSRRSKPNELLVYSSEKLTLIINNYAEPLQSFVSFTETYEERSRVKGFSEESMSHLKGFTHRAYFLYPFQEDQNAKWPYRQYDKPKIMHDI